MPSYRLHGDHPESAGDRAERRMPKGAPMNEHLRVVCPHCDATNRVLRARLGTGANCGGCKRALLSGHPFEIRANA
jgi:uncharacterized protein (DUF983 family)